MHNSHPATASVLIGETATVRQFSYNKQLKVLTKTMSVPQLRFSVIKFIRKLDAINGRNFG